MVRAVLYCPDCETTTWHDQIWHCEWSDGHLAMLTKKVNDWMIANPGKPIPVELFGVIPDQPNKAKE